MSDVKTQHPKQVQNLNLLRILKVVGALKRKRQKDAILCDFQSISISLTLPACWAMLGLALCCFPSQTETCNKKEIRIWFLGSSESFPTKFLWPKLDVKSFLFLFHALWPDSRLPCFQAHACIKCRLGPAWHSDSSEKTDVWFNRKKLGSTQRGKFFIETYRTKLSKSMRFNEINDLFKKADAEGLGRACMSLKFAILNIRLLPSRVLLVLYLCFFLRRVSKLGGNCTNPNVNVWFWHQKQTWRSHFFRPTPWPILNTFWNYPPPSNSHILPFLVGNPELNLHLWLASWDRPKICLCACVFPLRSLEKTTVKGDDQRLSGNLDDGHSLGNGIFFFFEYWPFVRGWFQIHSLKKPVRTCQEALPNRIGSSSNHQFSGANC